MHTLLLLVLLLHKLFTITIVLVHGHHITKHLIWSDILQSISKGDSSQCLESLWQTHQELEREVLILHLLTQTLEIIDDDL